MLEETLPDYSLLSIAAGIRISVTEAVVNPGCNAEWHYPARCHVYGMVHYCVRCNLES